MLKKFTKLFLVTKHISQLHSFTSRNRMLFTMKLSEDKMKHVLKPGVLILSQIFLRHSFEIRVAGGAVRDLLMDIIPTDLDFASTATPDEMKTMFEKEEVRMVNAGGEKHGTITARIEEENYECTTLRIDKLTDGRHAEVEFIRDWELDAGRRDLTINALFLGLDGTVYDYFNGIEHLSNREIKFVGSPDQRIQEDYLRILRYFRFFGRVSNDPYKHDSKIVESIKNNCHGLGRISGERIWMELKKILVGRFGGESIEKMVQCGVGNFIGLPHDYDLERLGRIYARLKNSDYQPCTLLAAGLSSEEDAKVFINRIKCSNKEKDTLLFIINHRKTFTDIDSIKAVQGVLVDMVYKEKKSKDIVLFLVTELIKYVGRKDLQESINNDLIPFFPIKGGMLIDKVSKKNQIQKEMKRLLELWKNSDYQLSREELLNEVNNS